MSSQAVTFIKSLELPKSVTSLSQNPSAQVVAGSIASFTAALSGQQLEDVQNSTLLAQLAATKKYPNKDQIEDWYNFYTKVLGEIGWILQSFSFNTYTSDQASFKLSDVTLELLSALVGDDKELLTLVKSTLDSLAKSDEGITLFDTHSTHVNAGHYQILPCTLTNNQVSVAFIGAYFTASKVSKDYFFASYKSEDMHLQQTAQVFSLDEEMYAKVRQDVIDKFDGHAPDFIHNLKV